MDRMHVRVIVDRPMGSKHPSYDMIYPVNYGYVPDVMGGDGEEQDAYILGVDLPLSEFEGIVIAIIHRFDDNEDKWVVAPEGMNFTENEIKEKLFFQEKYFNSEIIISE